MPFQYDVNTGTFTGMPQMKQNSGESSTNNEYSERQSSAPEQQASLNNKPSLDTKAQNQGVPSDTSPSQQQTNFTQHMGNAPIAEKLAKQAGVQLDAPNYLDYTKQREIINQ